METMSAVTLSLTMVTISTFVALSSGTRPDLTSAVVKPPKPCNIRCLRDPCDGREKCARFPWARCESDCCVAHWYLGDHKDKEVTNECELNGRTTKRPQTTRCNRQCFVDPCRVEHCPKFPRATCKSDCCIAHWTLANHEEVTDRCGSRMTTVHPPTPACTLLCKRDVCNKQASCPNHPHAKCVSECCVAHWILPNQKDVTKTC